MANNAQTQSTTEEKSPLSDSDAKLEALAHGPGADLLKTKLDYAYIVDILLFEIKSFSKMQVPILMCKKQFEPLPIDSRKMSQK